MKNLTFAEKLNLAIKTSDVELLEKFSKEENDDIKYIVAVNTSTSQTILS